MYEINWTVVDIKDRTKPQNGRGMVFKLVFW